MEEMDLTDLYSTYERIRENQATPRQLLKILLYGYMNREYSSRAIETRCKRDINFMYLLEDKPAPDHATIARFRSMHFSLCAEKLLAQMSNFLYEIGEISGEIVLKLRNVGFPVKLICASPFPGLDRSWSDDWKQRYRQLSDAADQV